MATMVLSFAANTSGLSGFSLFAAQAAALVAGTYIDNKLFGADNSQEGPRIDSVNVTNSTEGGSIPRIFGKMRTGGNVIWATNFKETTVVQKSGGKGAPGSSQKTTTYQYTTSFAVAFCEGNSRTSLGRIWADGKLLDTSGLTFRFYRGDNTQTKDPKIVAVEGDENTPAFRGIAYVVFEDMNLENFGNRIPQITAEITVPIDDNSLDLLENLIEGVNLIPSTGESAYSSIPQVSFAGFDLSTSLSNPSGAWRSENVFLKAGQTNIEASMEDLTTNLPNNVGLNLVVSWFGTDLRLNNCEIVPKVETDNRSGKLITPDDWSVSGQTYQQAEAVSDVSGKPAFGGTPSDSSITQAITYIANEVGQELYFYPFLLMDIPSGNTLPDTETGASGQPVYPWRGRITTSLPSVQKTSAAESEIDDFFGSASSSDFIISGTTVTYAGSVSDKGYRRMILHYAHLCAEAAKRLTDPTKFKGFYVGTELRGVTQTRGAGTGNYPGVTRLTTLLGDVRTIFDDAGLTHVELSYAADWSEYHSHRPDDGSGDVFFNMDELWSDSNCDYIAIDNYLPISDWRDGVSHADYGTGADVYGNPRSKVIYDQNYLRGQVEGGEYYDYFYASAADRENQIRTNISDGSQASFLSSSSFDELVDTDGVVTVSNVSPQSGSSRIMIVMISWETANPKTVSSVTWGAQTLTSLGQVNKAAGTPENSIAVFYLLDSDFVGSASDVTVTLSSSTSNDLAVSVSQFQNAEQTAPTLDSYTSFSSGDRDYETTVSSVSNGGVILTGLSSGGAAVTTADAGQTVIFDSSSGDFDFHVSYKLPQHENEKTVGLDWNSALIRGVFVAVSFNGIGINKPWTYRQKDIRNWWLNLHYNRPGGVESVSPTSWSVSSKRIVFSEFGAPAIDKSTNQPNVFFDPKSSESFFPYHSSGERDDQIQRSYYEAVINYWGDNSPTSPITMIDTSDMFAWTWDVRPYPAFPFRQDIWSDGVNWRLGHWLTGRVGVVPLAKLVEIICGWVGIGTDQIDTTGLLSANAIIRGFIVDKQASPREILDSLFSAYLFDAFESEGKIKFVLRVNTEFTDIPIDNLVVENSNNPGGYSIVRAQETELPRSMTVSYLDEDKEYLSGSVGTTRQNTDSLVSQQLSFLLAFPESYAKSLSEVLLQESLAARESIEFTIPSQYIALDPGEGVRLTIGNRDIDFRLSDIEQGSSLSVSANSITTAVYENLVIGDNSVASSQTATVYGPSELVFLDIPLVSVDEDRHWAPRLAAYQDPYPESVNVYEDTGSDIIITNQIERPSVMGVLTKPLLFSPPEVIDEGNILDVTLYDENFQVLSDTEDNVRNGANALAVQTSNGDWEIIKFVEASLQLESRYHLYRLFRGQLGTSAIMESSIPAGSRVVFLDSSVIQPLAISEERRSDLINWRYGASNLATSDSFYKDVSHTGKFVGLLPYPVADIQFREIGVNVEVSWKRQTRYGGEGFEQPNVPLNEESELYEVELYNSSDVLQETIFTSSSSYIFTSPPNNFKVHIYQISASVGRGRKSEAQYGG